MGRRAPTRTQFQCGNGLEEGVFRVPVASLKEFLFRWDRFAMAFQGPLEPRHAHTRMQSDVVRLAG